MVWYSLVEILKQDHQLINRDHFLMPTSLKNGGLHVCFMCLSLLGRFSVNFQKMAAYPKVVNALNKHLFYHFWGDVGIKKWSLFLSSFSIRSAIFRDLKSGTFGKSARFQVLENGTSDAESA